MSSKKKTIPEVTIKLLGKTIKLRSTNNPELFGEYKADEKTIYLNLSTDDLESTLLHEMVHALLAITAQDQLLSDEQAEAVCRIAEHLITVPGFKTSLSRLIKKLDN